MIELRRAETLGIGTPPSKAAMAKMGADLMALHAEYQAHLTRTNGQGAAAPAFKSSNALAPIAEGAIVIDAAASGDPESLAADLRALGAENVTVFGRLVSARLPITAIPAAVHIKGYAGDVGAHRSVPLARHGAAVRGCVGGTGELQ